jgi:heptosyltransferase-1
MASLSEILGRRPPGKVCIIKPSSLGDVVHSVPILPELRRLWPDAHLTWVVSGSFRSLLEGREDLDRVIPYEKGPSGVSWKGLRGLASVCGTLAREGFDLTIDLQGLLRSGLMTAATRAPVRVGLDDAREGARRFYTHRVDAPRARVHAVDRVMIVAEALGGAPSTPEFSLPIRPEDDAWADRTLAAAPAPRMVVNVGSRWLTKRWPVGQFAEVARRAVAEFGAGIVAVGAPEDRPLVDALREAMGRTPVLDLCGATTLLQLGALARRSDVYLSNDTGPLHLAAATGVTVVGIYTCTDPGLTGPYGPNSVAVKSCMWCAPSFLKNCDRLECHDEVSPDRVWAVVRPRLARAMGSAA